MSLGFDWADLFADPVVSESAWGLDEQEAQEILKTIEEFQRWWSGGV